MKLAKMLALGFVAIVLLGAAAIGVKMGTADFQHPNTPYPDIKASTDPAVIARGKYVVENVAHCNACHQAVDGLDLKKGNTINFDAPLSGGYEIHAGPFGTFIAQNITPDKETGIGRYTDAEVARVIRAGIDPKGQFAPMMRLAVGPISDDDLVAVLSYLRSLPPVKAVRGPDEMGPIAKLLASDFKPREGTPPKDVPASEEPTVARGEYLVNGPALCAGCHSPLDPMNGFAPSGPPLSGAAAADPDPYNDGMELIAPNLTPDPATGWAGKLDEDGFVARLVSGRNVKHSPMPWESYARLTDSDKRSIYRYLKTVPPTVNDVGPTYREAGWSPE